MFIKMESGKKIITPEMNIVGEIEDESSDEEVM